MSPLDPWGRAADWQPFGEHMEKERGNSPVEAVGSVGWKDQVEQTTEPFWSLRCHRAGGPVDKIPVLGSEPLHGVAPIAAKDFSFC